MHHKRQIIGFGVFSGLFTLGIFLFAPYLSAYIHEVLGGSHLYGLSIEMWIGIMASVSPLTIILCTHIMGSLSDEIGRRRIVMLGLIASAVGMALYFFSVGPLTLILSRALSIVGTSTVLLITLAKVNDLTLEKERGKSQGVFFSIQFIGRMIGPLAASWLVVFLPTRYIFPISGAIFVLLLVYLLRQKAGKFRPQHKASFSIFENWTKFLGFRKLKGMAVLGMTMNAQVPVVMWFTPLLILARFPGHYEYLGFSAFAFAALAPFGFLAGNLADRYGKAKITLVGCVVTGLSLFLIPLTGPIWELLLVLLLFSAGNSLWNVGAWTVLSSIGEANHVEGHIVGSYASISKVGDFVASLSFGAIAATVGITALFPIAAFIVMVGILISLFFLRDVAPA